MKKSIYLICLIISVSFLISNSAQPGVWNAGGSGVFKLLYPKDSIAYKKIQMKSENIFMQIYNGFATVKGNYYFKNTTKDTLTIKVGYPINNVFENITHNNYANNVTVDGLYKIKGLINGQAATLIKKPNEENDNWYVWSITFPPNKITKFTVYFLVNTNNAKITRGYNSNKKNAFIYLIETGSLWKPPIEKGNFYTQLKDKILIHQIKSSSPTKLFFNKENSTLKFSLFNYGKSPDSNFVITYGEKLENFNFKEITKKSESYFKTIDLYSNNNFNNFSYDEIKLPNVYKVDGISNGIIGFTMFIANYGLLFLFGIFLICFFSYYNKKRRLKK